MSNGDRLLDAGCGTGNLIRDCARWGPTGLDVIGFDASDVMLRRARGKFSPAGRTSWQRGDLNAPLPFEESSFTRIACCNVLFALADPERTLGEFYRVLSPGGRLVLATPNQDISLEALRAAHFNACQSLGEKIGYYALRARLGILTLFNLVLLRAAKKRQVHFFAADELAALVRRAGFDILRFDTTYAGQDHFVVAERK